MLASVPLLIIPLLLYNFGLVAGWGENPWDIEVLSLQMMSGGVFVLDLGTSLVLVALVLLFVEIVKSTRTSNASIVDHVLSTAVFVVFLIEFLLVRSAAHAVFFTLMLISLLDVLAGFSVSLRSAGRDVNLH